MRIEDIGEIQKVSLSDNDYLVISTDDHLSLNQQEKLKEHAKAAFPTLKNPIVVLGKGMKISIVSKEQK